MLLWHLWTADFSFSGINYSESDQYIMFSPVCSHAFQAGFRGICDGAICNDCNIIFVRNYAVLPEKVTGGTLFHMETGSRLEDGAKNIENNREGHLWKKKKLRWCNYYFTFRKGLCSGGTVHYGWIARWIRWRQLRRVKWTVREGGASSVKPSTGPDEDRQVNDGAAPQRKLLQRRRNTVQMEDRDCWWKTEVSLCASFQVLLRVAQKPRLHGLNLIMINQAAAPLKRG